MNIHIYKVLACVLATFSLPQNELLAQTDSTATIKDQTLKEVMVVKRRSGTIKLRNVDNASLITGQELLKAACCNLGESFTTNPSVDVNYSDAATGAKQIKLLGLSGTYVQMLTENLPNFRGAAAPYSLGYIPGPWMKSIMVSKGASSVRNGYESITGQINVDYLKPEDEEGATINLYGNTKSKMEANADGNIHLGKVNTEILGHYENDWGHHDDNGDGFLDQPNVRQVNLQNRWQYAGQTYIFHGGLGLLDEQRDGGQTRHTAPHVHNPYEIGLKTRRYEAHMKHAFILDAEKGTNVALMASGSLHNLEALYGKKTYDVDEKNGYLQLMFETNLTKLHNLSAGFSLNHDYLKEKVKAKSEEFAPAIPFTEGVPVVTKETTPGAYLQYTLNINDKIVAMAGLRADHSSHYGTFVTPRLHLKYAPSDVLTLRVSAGKGYRTPFALAENNYLLASGRTLVVDDLKQEEAWNYGISAAWSIPLADKLLKVNAEYYYTHFLQQMLIDYDSNPQQIRLANLDGKSYSHTFQVDVSYPVVNGLELTAAYRLNDVRATYGGELREKPLQSKYKGLLTASYKTPLGLWQFDATFQLNGGGRMPDPYQKTDGTLSWDRRFPAYGQLNAQVTRWFRHFSVYVGGENLTGYRQENSIIGASDPWGSEFEPTMVWGPVHGRMFYAGIRVNLGKKL
ncbi:TonB-dependent receptor plug domain-containing protein [Prevotella communis]|uniref:TonB-dependent receptor plug domain-containing protein n=1 Tax=Prevotella communis TaxID=2913614 RepID=UPI001ED9FC22|nr:TonB-dependent receptor [Prevotella communis]UKK56751.1 TonB-dependent receptor [Prevotella communis]